MILKPYLGLLLLLINTSLSKAEANYELTRVNEFYSFITLKVSANKPVFYLNEKALKFTSIKIEFNQPCESHIKIGYRKADGIKTYLSSKFQLLSDDTNEGLYSTTLEIFSIPQSELDIDFGNFAGRAKIILLYAPPLSNATLKRLNKTMNRCDKPEMISYVVWREFLPNPKPSREATDVEHLVVHHSAGNNSDSDYVGIVRNIYLLHTQTNGWDDIGYNFLVAPNGVIFNGRDPQGVADDDDILGAHYCGKNQNTMGVCIIGDFMNVKPTPEALFSLKYLLAWKLKKDSIDAFGQTKHPRETGNLLENICGHRNGCNTACPGDSLFALLPIIKKDAHRIADSCGLILTYKKQDYSKVIKIFPNPVKGSFTISSNIELDNPRIFIYGLTGSLITETSFEQDKPIVFGLKQGVYQYNVIDAKALRFQGRLIVIE